MPEAACARRCALPFLLAVAICSAPGLGQEAARVARKPAKHFAALRLEIDSLDALRVPGAREMLEAIREELARTEFKGLDIPKLTWPLRASFAWGDASARKRYVRIETHDDRLVFAPWWEAYLARQAKGQNLPKFPTRELGGVRWTMPMFAVSPRAYEGVVNGKLRLNFCAGPQLGDSLALSAPFAKLTTRERRLWEPIKNHSGRALLSIEALIRSVSRKEGGGLRLILGQLVGQVTGLAVGWSQKGELTVMQGVSDFRVGGGLFGSLFHREKRQPRLIAWMPADITECSALRLDPRAVARALRTILAMTKVDLEEEWGLSLRDLTRIVANHLDGELGFLLQRTKADKALDVDAEEPFVLMLGTPDEVKFLRELKAHEELEEVQLFGEPGFVMGDEAGGAIYLVAKKRVLFVSNGDPVSKRMLQRALATRGQAGIPKCIQEKLGPGPFPSDLLSATWFSSAVSAEVWKREVRGRETPAMAARLMSGFLRRVEKRGGLRAASWVRVTKKGTEFYSVY